METEFGVVIFDDQTVHESGWACKWSGEDTRPIRIANTGDLSSDTVWLTNLGYEASKLSGIQGMRFRRDSFFNHPLPRLWGELGLDTEFPLVNLSSVWGGRYTQPTMLRAALSAWMFRQAVFAADALVPLNAPPLSDLAHGFHEQVIPSEPRLFFPSGLVPPDGVLDALEQANLTWQPVARPAVDNTGKRRMRVFPDRLTHAISLLSAYWPVGGWKETGELKLLSGKAPEHIEDWLRENPMALLRVTVKRTDRDMEPLINHGANISRNPRQGHWLTATDVLRMLPWCDMRLHRGWVADQMASGFEWLARADVPLSLDLVEYRAGSWSFGLMMDVLWRAMSRGPSKLRHAGPAAAFVRAADRSFLFQSVCDLHAQGIEVTGYGGAGISVNVSEQTDPHTLATLLLDAGLSPPFTPSGVFEMDEALKLSREAASYLPESAHRLRAAMLLGDLASIIEMDEVLAQWTP